MAARDFALLITIIAIMKIQSIVLSKITIIQLID